MHRSKKNILISFLFLIALSLPLVTLADIKSYKLEQGIPFIARAGAVLNYEDFTTLFQKFITTAYIIAAVAAFIKILIAGIRWYTSGGSSKAISQSKEDIKNGIIGLCFIFLAGVLIEFINPNLNSLSDIYAPNAGKECAQGTSAAIIGEGGGNALTSFNGRNAQYSANGNLVYGLGASGVNFTITTGCTNTTDCKPNYCVDNCQPCTIGGTTCKPLTDVPCHFNGTCVDLDSNDSDVIHKIQCAGLDILDERGDNCGASTGSHLHVFLHGTFTPSHTGADCWYKASEATGC